VLTFVVTAQANKVFLKLITIVMFGLTLFLFIPGLSSIALSYNGYVRYLVSGDARIIKQENADFVAESCNQIVKELEELAESAKFSHESEMAVKDSQPTEL